MKEINRNSKKFNENLRKSKGNQRKLKEIKGNWRQAGRQAAGRQAGTQAGRQAGSQTLNPKPQGGGWEILENSRNVHLKHLNIYRLKGFNGNRQAGRQAGRQAAKH